MQNCNDIMLAPTRSDNLPLRKGTRPKTIRGPLHIQDSGYGDPKYLNEFVDEILTWPHIESVAPSVSCPDTIRIRINQRTITSDPAAFLTTREFARVLVVATTIYMALPLVCAHWAIVRGWAEPHYLASFGLMPAGAVVVYTPRDEQELGICYFLFAESYRSACGLSIGDREVEHRAEIGKRYVG